MTVIGQTAARTLLVPWSRLLGPSALPLIATAFGDILFLDRQRSILLLDVQRAAVELIDDDIAWVLNKFLWHPAVVQDIVRRPAFEDLKNRFGELPYGRCYILNPWQMLGGVDQTENYTTGELGPYLDLVAQAAL